QEEAGAQAPAEKTDAEKLAEAEATIAALRDQMLRQMAEFDNFRKRTIKEKAELILSGGSRVLESLLPVMDDLERAQDNMAKASDVETLREGVDLIMQKLMKTLEANGLKKMDTRGVAFDTDFHEAIALTPAADEAQKNHVIDCVQAGYMLNDKVLRHAKVVVAQ
ncbi:MAG: nucleotide exchange factor GrpE, partial [Alloprevotella sp.]|nr:nucleotide exchange factor GrpE [Alloprevotella sp.]